MLCQFFFRVILLLVHWCDLECHCSSIRVLGVNYRLYYLSLLFLNSCVSATTVVRSDRSGFIIDLNSVIKWLREEVNSDGCAVVGEVLGLVSEVIWA